MTSQTAKSGVFHFKNYLVSDISLKALSFISVPILTRVLTKEDYGILNVFGAYVGIFTILFTFNASSSITRYFFENRENFGRLLTTVLIISLTSTIFCVAVMNWYIDYFSDLLGIPANLFLFFFSSILLSVIYTSLLQYCKANSDSVFMRNFNVSKGYTSFALVIILVLVLKEFKYLAVPIAEAIVLIIFAFVAFRKLWPLLKVRVIKEDLKFIFNFSVPLIPAGLSGLLLAQFDRVMLGNMKGMDQAGLYSFAYNIGMLQTMVMNALNSAYTPSFYHFMMTDNRKELDKELIFIVQLLASTAVFLTFWGDIIGKVLSGKDFHEGLTLIPIIICGLFFLSLSPFYKRGISFKKKTIYTSIIILLSGAINILLNYLFIPKYGMYAAAFSTLLAYIFQFGLTYIIVRYLLKLHITQIRKILKYLLIVVVAAILYFCLIYFEFSLVPELFIRIGISSILIYIIIQKSPRELISLILKKQVPNDV